MKKLLISFFFFTVCLSTFGQVKEVDTIIHKLFAALKAKDEPAFLKLYPGGEQMNRMMQAILEPQIPMMRATLKKAAESDNNMKNIDVDSFIHTMMSEYSNPAVMKKLLDKASDNFKKIIADGESKGVKWETAKLVSFEEDSVFADSQLNKMRETLIGVRLFKGIINFTSLNSPFRVTVHKILFMPLEQGWFGGEFGQVAREGETFTPNSDFDEKDVIIENRQTHQPPSPPPARKKVSRSTITHSKAPKKIKP